MKAAPKNPVSKSLAYAYPTSSNAVEFGFAKQGCWTVNTHAKPGGVPVAVAGYATEAEARTHLAKLPLPTNRFSL